MADTTPIPPHREPFALQVLEKMSQLMTAAVGLVAALAWNDAIKTAIQVYVGSGTHLRAQFLYAILVTLIAVAASMWIANAITRIKRRMRHEHPASPSS